MRTIPQRPELIADIAEAKEILADPRRAALVSVRTWNEHIGKVSGYNYIDPAGRIAGDVWGNCGTDAYHMQHYRNLDNTMRPYPEIAANWASSRDHTRQTRRLLLRHRLARQRDLVLRPPHGLERTSPSTTAAGGNGAATRARTRSRSACRRKRSPDSPAAPGLPAPWARGLGTG